MLKRPLQARLHFNRTEIYMYIFTTKARFLASVYLSYITSDSVQTTVLGMYMYIYILYKPSRVVIKCYTRILQQLLRKGFYFFFYRKIVKRKPTN